MHNGAKNFQEVEFEFSSTYSLICVILLLCSGAVESGLPEHSWNLTHREEIEKYHKVASSITSHVDFFRLHRKGIFDAYILCDLFMKK